MEQIKLVIKFPKDWYEQIKQMVEQEKTFEPAEIAIANGQILPKGHGDLIDRSKLEMSDIAPEPWYRPMMAYTEWTIDDAEVVVEADKEGAEEWPSKTSWRCLTFSMLTSI